MDEQRALNLVGHPLHYVLDEPADVLAEPVPEVEPVVVIMPAPPVPIFPVVLLPFLFLFFQSFFRFLMGLFCFL
jgi:hypothetical protein